MPKGEQLSTYCYEAEDPKKGLTINEAMAALQQLLDDGVSGEERLWSENKLTWGPGRKGQPISQLHVVWSRNIVGNLRGV